MKKYLISSVLIGTSVAIVGCGGDGENTGTEAEENNEGGEQAVNEDAEEVLSLGHVWPNSELHAQAAEEFAEEVSELTDGRLAIDLYEDGSLGDDGELLEGLQIGSADIWVGGSGVLSSHSDTAYIFTVPFMLEDHDHFNEVYDGEIGENISEQIAEESGYEILSYWARGARSVTSNQEINTPDDMEGFSIRVPDSPVFTNSFERMGASPTPMAIGEVFTSLQQGVIDGQENPLSLIYHSQFHEVQDYLIHTEHVREPITVVMDEGMISGLDEDLQEALYTAANGNAKEYAEEEVVESEDQYLEDLQEEGMNIVEPDIQAFQENMDGFVEEEFSHLQDIFEDIRALN